MNFCVKNVYKNIETGLCSAEVIIKAVWGQRSFDTFFMIKEKTDNYCLAYTNLDLGYYKMLADKKKQPIEIPESVLKKAACKRHKKYRGSNKPNWRNVSVLIIS